MRLKQLLYTGIASLVLGCGGGGGGHKNQPPVVLSASRFFRNDGMVEYTIKAQDKDGKVTKIYADFNGKIQAHNYESPTIISKLINQSKNRLELVAEDNAGAKSLEALIDRFSVLTDEQAYAHIINMLDDSKSKGGLKSYESDVNGITIYLDLDAIVVHFEIIRNDDTFALIKYVGIEDNLEREADNEEKLNEFRIHNLYLFRLPESEIHARLEDFIKKGYSSF